MSFIRLIDKLHSTHKHKHTMSFVRLIDKLHATYKHKHTMSFVRLIDKIHTIYKHKHTRVRLCVYFSLKMHIGWHACMRWFLLLLLLLFLLLFFFLKGEISAHCLMLDPQQERTFELDLSVQPIKLLQFFVLTLFFIYILCLLVCFCFNVLLQKFVMCKSIYRLNLHSSLTLCPLQKY